MKHFVILVIAAIVSMSFTVVDLKPVDSADAVTFTIKNFGLNTKGKFTGLKGTIKWDAADISKSSINVTVDTKTIDTDVDSRDSHLRKEEYFDVVKYPVINIASTAITTAGNGSFNAAANLTIKGVTKAITIPFTAKPDAKGFVFEGDFSINRRDYGVGGGSMVLGDEVKVKLKVLANP